LELKLINKDLPEKCEKEYQKLLRIEKLERIINEYVK
jgi:hypothetical protein